ncbi:N-6 DNA methylase [uncultured Selenomonas sp.]|uniref:N-6 DNA methylase n=1 Tax=uncultured Selenomonas sp. TaxID=159275 RepID=UPI0025DFE2D4|nr:N-6 DNA methylase [uncultured Selenomonas sp.]
MGLMRNNERSWQLELISSVNELLATHAWEIQRAGGELTISKSRSGAYASGFEAHDPDAVRFGKRSDAMFPDCLLFGDKERSRILQGWELKMPDVPVTDATYIADGRRKAIALSLDSYVLWNFRDVRIYVHQGNQWNIVRTWTIPEIRTREDVGTYQARWKTLLEEVLLTVNQFLVTGTIKNVAISEVLGTSILASFIEEHQAAVHEELKRAAYRDAKKRAELERWWRGAKDEYQDDETDLHTAYARLVLLHWVNRIVFAHSIKHLQNGALLVDRLPLQEGPEGGNEIFQNITSTTDFWNIFAPIPCNTCLPAETWAALRELSKFLEDKTIEHQALQNILEGTVRTSRRLLKGQYTTPEELAKILVRLTVRDCSGNVFDGCCGTGTIVRAALDQKLEGDSVPVQDVYRTLWASDKDPYALQLAGLSLASEQSIHIPVQLFRQNVLGLEPGNHIQLTEPDSGKQISVVLPRMDSIVSNLPFVAFERISEEDRGFGAAIAGQYHLSEKSDLYVYVTLHLADLLADGGYLGIILSNSWLGTDAGEKFSEAVKRVFHIRQVHLSGKGRWFQNASVVTTILLLQKKPAGETPSQTTYFLWKKSLEELDERQEDEQALIESALLEDVSDPSVVSMSSYSEEEMQTFRSLHLSMNANFFDIAWLVKLQAKLVPISHVFHVTRGSRRGWDPLFQPKDKHLPVEEQFIQPILLNAKDVHSLIANADGKAFCCSKTKEELRQEHCTKALRWIETFEQQRNKAPKPKPLPEALARKDQLWYEMSAKETATFFTMMNPDERFFFGRFLRPTFVSQRLIALNCMSEDVDQELCHALLNSALSAFFLEAIGFGRGQGVLDINKKKVASCPMLNPALLTHEQRDAIVRAFQPLLQREIWTTKAELQSKDRLQFEHTLFSAYGVEELFAPMVQSLVQMQAVRHAV